MVLTCNSGQGRRKQDLHELRGQVQAAIGLNGFIWPGEFPLTAEQKLVKVVRDAKGVASGEKDYSAEIVGQVFSSVHGDRMGESSLSCALPTFCMISCLALLIKMPASESFETCFSCCHKYSCLFALPVVYKAAL